MRAVIYERTGPAVEVLTPTSLPEPEPGPGEVLVRIAASGINPADVKRRAGWGGMAMSHPRIVPHCDGAGTIEAVGPGTDPSRVGQRVWLWNAQGGYGEAGRAHGTAAEYIALPSAQAVPLPDRYSLEQGACLGVPAMTAHRCVLADGPVAGQTLLVQGGAGAVGHLAVQIAVAEGARVVATVSTDAAAQLMHEAGATPIHRHTTSVADAVHALTDGAGVDRIVEVDFAANQTVDAALLRPNGTIAAYSSSSNPTPVLDYYALAAKGGTLRTVQGFALPPDARTAGQGWISRNALDIRIGATFPMDHCADAHLRVERGGSLGQTVLSI